MNQPVSVKPTDKPGKTGEKTGSNAIKAAPKTPEEIAKLRQQRVEKFKELANKRVAKAIKAISIIKNLTGPAYVFDDHQRIKIIKYLGDEVNALDKAFVSALARKSGEKTEAVKLDI